MARPTENQVIATLDGIADPCMLAAGLDLSLVDLGLIYGVEISADRITVHMTMTEAGCPFTHRVMEQSYVALEALAPEMTVDIVPVWQPLWTEERMNPRARAAMTESRLAMVKRFAGAAQKAA